MLITQHDVWSWRKSNFLIQKEKKIGHPEHSLYHFPTSDNISFLSYPTPPTPQKRRHMCITAKWCANIYYLFLKRGTWNAALTCFNTKQTSLQRFHNKMSGFRKNSELLVFKILNLYFTLSHMRIAVTKLVLTNEQSMSPPYGKHSTGLHCIVMNQFLYDENEYWS